jgi:hypothetical protein
MFGNEKPLFNPLGAPKPRPEECQAMVAGINTKLKEIADKIGLKIDPAEGLNDTVILAELINTKQIPAEKGLLLIHLIATVKTSTEFADQVIFRIETTESLKGTTGLILQTLNDIHAEAKAPVEKPVLRSEDVFKEIDFSGD